VKKAAQVAGVLLTLAAVVWIALKIRSLAAVDLLGTMRAISIGALAVSFTLFCAAYVMLAVGWVALLELLEGRPLLRQKLTLLYLRTHIGKYLPGSVGHYVLRLAMGRAYGISHSNLIHAVFWEAGSLALLSGLAGAAFMGSVIAYVTRSGWPWVVIGCGAACAAVFAIRKFRVVQHSAWPRPMLRMIGAHAAFLLLSASAMAALFQEWNGRAAPPLFVAPGAWACAWLIGFATPGAPGGVGVRESVLIFLLAPYTGEAPALAVALVSRVLNIAAEVVLWAVTLRPGVLQPARTDPKDSQAPEPGGAARA
jgi:glycosyltransferase 2 family protein